MKHRGFSLMEMLVVMACMTLMFALTSEILLQLWSTVRATREQGEVSAAMSRLSAQFREDVHRATAVEITDSCNLTLDDGNQAFYMVYGDRLARVEANGKNTIRRDSFALPAEAAVMFKQASVAEKTFVELRLTKAAAVKHEQHLLTLRSCLGRGTTAPEEAP